MSKKLFLTVICMILIGVGLWYDKAQDKGQSVGTNSARANNRNSSVLSKHVGQEQISKAQVSRRMVNLHIPFIANEGQTDERVKFYADTFGGTVFVTDEAEVAYSLPKFEGKKGDDKTYPKSVKTLTLKEKFTDRRVSKVKGEGKAVTKVSYFKGSDRSKWKSGIPTYDVVSLGEVYEGVELKLKAYGDNVEKLFFVKPGAEPESIGVKLSGGKLSVNREGELEVETELGTVKFTKPVAYQDGRRKREFVEVAYVVKEDKYGFKVGEYDKGKELVIDPLLASTFLGGSNIVGDNATNIILDTTGNVYVVGSTGSSDFPGVDLESAQSDIGMLGDAFIAKLNNDLSSILSATFLGGNNADTANDVTLDETGNVYVAGDTNSSDFPGVAAGSADNTFDGENEAFVAKLDSELGLIIAATFLGGDNFFGERAFALTLDDMGDVYVAGATDSSDFPGVDAESADDTPDINGEGFVAKLDSDLSSIISATLLGGDDGIEPTDFAVDIVLDGIGNVFM